MSTATQNTPDCLEMLMTEIHSGRIQVYLSVSGRPYIHFAIPGHATDRYPVSGEATRGWIAYYAFAECGVPLDPRELRQIIEILGGMALKAPRLGPDDPGMLQLLREDPIIIAVVEFMEGLTYYEDRMKKLWEKLAEQARRGDYSRLAGRRMPGGPNTLSRLLTANQPVWSSYGLMVEVRRSNGSRVKITKLDAPAAGSSAEASAVNPLNTNDLRAADSKDDRIKMLRDFDNMLTTGDIS